MERLIQFTVDFDDATVKSRIEERAYKVIADDLKSDVRRNVINNYGELTAFGEAIIRNFLTENNDKIIERAGQIIAEKAMRTKAWKGKFGDIMEGKAE